jgi:serine/threonine protein kinase
MIADKQVVPMLKTLGRYRVLKVLGEGAMGTVYRAFDPLIERPVAVKTISLRFDRSEMESFKERFYREAKSAGRLNHPNIVTIHDVGETGEIAYLAMELLEGLSLKQVIDAGTKLAPERIARIVAEVADALAYAHDNGIIHRDVKPANIALTRNGLVKITDFGIAQMPAGSHTMPGLMVGSPKYMSPEQVTGCPLDGRTDVFSLSVVLYELLVGHTPFEGSDFANLMYKIAHYSPLPPSVAAPGVAPAFDAVVAKALAKDRDHRYQNAREMARDLRTLIQTLNASPPEIKPLSSAPQASSSANAVAERASAKPRRLLRQPVIHRHQLLYVPLFAALLGAGIVMALERLIPLHKDPTPTLGQDLPFAAMPIPIMLAEAAQAPPPPLGELPKSDVEAKPTEPEATPAVKNKGKNATPGQVKPTPASKPSRAEELDDRLKQLKTDLIDLRAKYTDKHPDVVTTKRQIRQLEEEIGQVK